jgi:hypothetical protein
MVSGTLSVLDQYKSSFRLPAATEINALAQEALRVTDLIRGISQPLMGLESAIRSMHSPWLHNDNALQSLRSFAEIQVIGRAVNMSAPYDESVSLALRGALGDWRGVSSFPAPIFEDVVARSDFYIGLGFNPSLTDFTAQAFDETTALAGLSPIQRDETEPNEDDEEGLVRTNRAHDQFQRFERKVRRCIDARMAEVYGADWMRRQMPSGMFEEWKKKRDEAVAKGEAEQPLISYADFTDYKKIIERNDNWTEVFKAIFGRREDVQESFMRLFPIRVSTMHSRIILLDDELLLRVETRRILRAMGRQT